MRRITTLVPAALLVVGAAGCNNFLNSDKSVQDPNSPTAASTNQLFVGAQAAVFGQQEGGIAMIVCQWMQACAGVNGRFVQQQATYSIDAGTFDFQFSDVYRGGGLLSLRTIQARADAAGDKVYKGVAEVLEAMDIGFAADVWGSIPYREATADKTSPAFDPQMQIYADLQALLDQAITDLGGAGTGPGDADLVYGGDKAKWIQAAHTLKARFYLHTVEATGGATSPAYAQALAQANLGISSAANDWLTKHSSATSERNLWAQFQVSSFGDDLVAGSALVSLMQADNDPRLPDYYGENALGGYGGYDVTTEATPVNQISPIRGSNRTNDVEFRQPIITYDENQLIIAEAQFRANNTTAARTALNNVRARYNKTAKTTVTLADIMNEKYMTLFQNVEVWNDWKRTCLPVLRPARSKAAIPGRIIYGQTEEQTNANFPQASQTPVTSVRNTNDPQGCP
jgi:hypothetical protein